MRAENFIDSHLQEKLHRIAYHLLRDEMDAEDAVQDAICNLWSSRIPVTPEEAQFRLFTILRNGCMNKLKRKRHFVDISECEKTTDNSVLDETDRIKSRLQISPFSQFFGIFDRYVPIYTPYLDGSAILRQYENSGNHYRTQIGVAVTAKFLNGNLQIQVMPSQFFYKSTGYYNIDYNPFAFACSAIYYIGNFYFSGFYEMKNRTLWSNSGTIYKDRSQLQFSAGWSKSDLNVRIGVSNPFRTSWISSSKYFETPIYKDKVITYGATARFNLNFSVTYTFGYGKNVSRNNEVGEQTGGTSAILR